jgi:hypothetical protein
MPLKVSYVFSLWYPLPLLFCLPCLIYRVELVGLVILGSKPS